MKIAAIAVAACGLVATASPVAAQVRFFGGSDIEIKTLENGAASELSAKVKITKAARTKKFDEVGLILKFDGNLGVHSLTTREKPQAFRARFTGDDLLLRIVPAAGHHGDILSNAGADLTFDDLMDGAVLENRTETTITLVVEGWNVVGYTSTRVWKEGEQKWVVEKEPKWATTTLAKGELQITKVTRNPKKQRALDARLAYGRSEYAKALELAEQAIKDGATDLFGIATMAACGLKNEQKAYEYFKGVKNPADRDMIRLGPCRWVTKLDP
jgi:hypothetical protein